MIHPLGTHIRSTRDPKIVGTIRGFGTLFIHKSIDEQVPKMNRNPVVVYLVWDDKSPGSNSLINPTVHVLDVDHVEECEQEQQEIV